MFIFSLLIFFSGMIFTFTVGQLFIIESMLFGLKLTEKEMVEHTTENYMKTSYAHHHEQECICMPINLCKTYAYKEDQRKDKRYNTKYFRLLFV